MSSLLMSLNSKRGMLTETSSKTSKLKRRFLPRHNPRLLRPFLLSFFLLVPPPEHPFPPFEPPPQWRMLTKRAGAPQRPRPVAPRVLVRL